MVPFHIWNTPGYLYISRISEIFYLYWYIQKWLDIKKSITHIYICHCSQPRSVQKRSVLDHILFQVSPALVSSSNTCLLQATHVHTVGSWKHAFADQAPLSACFCSTASAGHSLGMLQRGLPHITGIPQNISEDFTLLAIVSCETARANTARSWRWVLKWACKTGVHSRAYKHICICMCV